MLRLRIAAVLSPALIAANFAAAEVPGPLPPGPWAASGAVADEDLASRPAIVSRPIFTKPATASLTSTKGTARVAGPATHRQPLSLVPQKAVAAPKTPDAKNPAPPAMHGSSTVPHHRRALGW